MSSRSPCGYCGANIVRFQSGVKYATTMRAAATARSSRGQPPTGSCRNRAVRTRRAVIARLSSLSGFDQHVALHLLMQRRAEMRAVVREDALMRGRERHGLCLARIHLQVDVVVDQG